MCRERLIKLMQGSQDGELTIEREFSSVLFLNNRPKIEYRRSKPVSISGGSFNTSFAFSSVI